MTEISLVKLPDGGLKGMSDRDQLAYNRFRSRLKNAEPGEVIEIEAKLPRNSRFHRKFFALLNLGFEHWEPGRKHKQYKGMPVAKNFDHFRSDILILSGFYEQTFNIDGEFRLSAKSISFSAMDEAEFEKVYSAVATVLLEKVFVNYKNRSELDDVVDKVLGFL